MVSLIFCIKSMFEEEKNVKENLLEDMGYIPNKQKPLDLHSEAPQAGTPTQRPQPDHTD